MGHENVGTIVEAGRHLVERQGLGAGDRVFRIIPVSLLPWQD